MATLNFTTRNPNQHSYTISHIRYSFVLCYSARDFTYSENYVMYKNQSRIEIFEYRGLNGKQVKCDMRNLIRTLNNMLNCIKNCEIAL